MFTGYKLSEESRNKLKRLYPPKYSKFIGHHITHTYGVDKNEKAPENPNTCKVVGYIDKNGVEGFLVEINGSSLRNDGSKYHITWSIEDNRKPVDTNKYVNDATPIKPIDIDVISKNFHHSL